MITRVFGRRLIEGMAAPEAGKGCAFSGSQRFFGDVVGSYKVHRRIEINETSVR